MRSVLTRFVESAPWLPGYLEVAMPAAMWEFAPLWEHPELMRTKLDRLTVDHQLRLGVTLHSGDHDAPRVPVATSAAMLIASCSDGLQFGSPRAKKGTGKRPQAAVNRQVVVLAALTRALAVLALTEGLTITGREWTRHMPVVWPAGGGTTSGTGPAVETLAAEAVQALGEADDDAFTARLHRAQQAITCTEVPGEQPGLAS